MHTYMYIYIYMYMYTYRYMYVYPWNFREIDLGLAGQERDLASTGQLNTRQICPKCMAKNLEVENGSTNLSLGLVKMISIA